MSSLDNELNYTVISFRGSRLIQKIERLYMNHKIEIKGEDVLTAGSDVINRLEERAR